MGYKNDNLKYFKYIEYIEYIIDSVKVLIIQYVFNPVLSPCHIEFIQNTRLACIFSAWNIRNNKPLGIN